MIIGCHNKSNVTIIPNNDITVPSNPQNSAAGNIKISAGQSFKFILHSLQTFLIFKPCVDFTGTKIHLTVHLQLSVDMKLPEFQLGQMTLTQLLHN